MSPRASFRDLGRAHGDLDETFLAHLEALLERRFADALAALARFERDLRLHMRHEDELLLPLFEERRDPTGEPRDTGARLYTLEHGRMLELLERHRDRTRDAIAKGPPTTRGLLALLDRAHTFRHLVEHHDARERRVLYPELDLLTAEDERREILERCTREWAEARDAAPAAP